MLAAILVEAARVGLGAEYRLAADKLAGATLVAEERVARLMTFPVESAHQHDRADRGRDHCSLGKVKQV